jgi:hypothetical protein
MMLMMMMEHTEKHHKVESLPLLAYNLQKRLVWNSHSGTLDSVVNREQGTRYACQKYQRHISEREIRSKKPSLQSSNPDRPKYLSRSSPIFSSQQNKNKYKNPLSFAKNLPLFTLVRLRLSFSPYLLVEGLIEVMPDLCIRSIF